ncbi:MAG: S8 family serine peptidase [Candidatus Eremiobacteraeota bacterium]|nr:S8 family serine peptidase [Candidatus Eremiobacteraeota bacterium]
MNGSLKLAAPLLLVVAAAACNAGGSSSVPAVTGQPTTSTLSIPDWQASHAARRACAGSRTGGQMQCDALILNKRLGPAVPGWTPANLEAAYNLPSSSKGAGNVVAVVDAFDNPNVASDLAEYRSYFGLPTATFYKYNQTGQQGSYPKGNQGWGVEIDLDVQMVSAACPNCTIYLIEANTNSSRNLYDAEKEAVKLGARVITNSWGGGGGGPAHGAFSASAAYLASAGDGGYGMQDPADYKTVISVGGTLLSQSGSTYSERVWPSSGGGCSVVNKPTWQHDPDCAKKTGNDVSAVAMGVAEYDTYGYSGWFTVGGTSVSSPLIAGVFGLAGNGNKQDGGKNFWKLSKRKLKKDLHAITTGQVMGCPPSLSGSYLCVAGTGQYGQYSGPSGWGTPKGIGAF